MFYSVVQLDIQLLTNLLQKPYKAKTQYIIREMNTKPISDKLRAYKALQDKYAKWQQGAAMEALVAARDAVRAEPNGIKAKLVVKIGKTILEDNDINSKLTLPRHIGLALETDNNIVVVNVVHGPDYENVSLSICAGENDSSNTMIYVPLNVAFEVALGEQVNLVIDRLLR